MARDIWVNIDRGKTRYMRVEVSGRGYIPSGTVTRGRLLHTVGRPRLVDPKDWIALRIEGVVPKSIGNAPAYTATRLNETIGQVSAF